MSALPGLPGPTRGGTSTRRADIQGLRALAVILVVVYHTGIALPGGFVGVDVFFVISGYVITRTLRTELVETGRIRLGRFYHRRVRRLLPALGVMLTLVMLASGLLASVGGQRVTARTGLSAALVNANTYLIRFVDDGYFDPAAEANALLHTWSLSVEEQFYLVFPATLLGAWLIGAKARRLAPLPAAVAVLAVITITSFVLSVLTTYDQAELLGIGGVATKFAFFSAPTRAWEFAVGALLALAPGWLRELHSALGHLIATVGSMLVVGSAVIFDDNTPFPGTAALVPVAGALLLIASGEPPGGNAITRLLSTRPTQFVGDLSYSWYLWHWPLIVFAVALWPRSHSATVSIFAGTIALIPAYLSYRFIENPIRFRRAPRPGRTLALAAACVALPLFASTALTAANGVVRRSDTVVGLENHADFRRGCDNATPLLDRDHPDCEWPAPAGSATAVLVGDSNAGQFTDPFVTAANAVGVSATVATFSACPFVDLVVIRDGVANDDCASFVSSTLDDLITDRPDVVVIASASDAYIEGHQFEVRVPASGEVLDTPERKSAAWADGLVRVVDPLVAHGIDVVVIHPVPRLSGWDPSRCAAVILLVAVDTCSASVSRIDADRYRARAVRAELEATADSEARTIDVAGMLCPDGRCQSRTSSGWAWRDDFHISVEMSRNLTSSFAQLF